MCTCERACQSQLSAPDEGPGTHMFDRSLPSVYDMHMARGRVVVEDRNPDLVDQLVQWSSDV